MFSKTSLLIALLSSCFIAPLHADTPATKESNAFTQTTKDKAAWKTYLAKSQALRKADQVFLKNELKMLGQKKASLPEYTKEFGFEVKQKTDWFKSAEGKRVMDIILSFQTPSGGWSKRTDMSKAPRKPGQAFGVEQDYIPTFDNGATSTQLMLLAQAHQATGDKRYSDAFAKGLDFIIAAQYPNGGWPQNFPLVGGYHDHITYNDALMSDLMVILHKVALAQEEYSFATPAQQQAAQTSLSRALDCVLKTQVISNGKRTIWGAQHDAKTLQPAKARAYEMISLTSSESVGMLNFLMDLESPSSEIINAIHAAAAWYEENKIVGKTWTRGDALLKEDTNAPPMWARFYEIGTNKPLFGDRDDSVHYELAKVSEERRLGYAWYTTSPNEVLAKYTRWAKQYPQ
ncbi:pectate lyase [Cellvibrio sp. OA-2007]|uniref:pectate lyase n=1 Tax=Cellvibrio sp. OA-2007 TaxID=529823 RepID=UPI00078471F8|nr:pectate lyase [Cellvibrio sp. OA-2007]